MTKEEFDKLSEVDRKLYAKAKGISAMLRVQGVIHIENIEPIADFLFERLLTLKHELDITIKEK